MSALPPPPAGAPAVNPAVTPNSPQWAANVEAHLLDLIHWKTTGSIKRNWELFIAGCVCGVIGTLIVHFILAAGTVAAHAPTVTH